MEFGQLVARREAGDEARDLAQRLGIFSQTAGLYTLKVGRDEIDAVREHLDGVVLRREVGRD